MEPIRQGDIPGVQLRCRRRLAVEVETAWEWLTRTANLERWLADRAEVEGEPGAPSTVLLETADPDVRERGETLTIDPPNRWVLSFRRLHSDWKAPTRVTLEVLPSPGGSEVMVFHEGFERLSLSVCLTVWEEYRRRWRQAFERLAAAVGSG